MLDIFDHPKEVLREKKAASQKKETSPLDYPNECFLKGDYEAAYKSCRLLIDYPSAKESKDREKVLYLLGISCLKTGRFMEARGYFNDILTQAKDEELKAQSCLGIADSYFLEGDNEAAFDAYNQLLNRYPASDTVATAYYKLALISSKTGRGKEAAYYLAALKNDFPDSFEARLSGDIKLQDEVYTVQVGCFNEKDNADKICEKLLAEGFDAYIIESEGSDEPRCRVRVGRLNSKDEAETLEFRLKQSGYPTKIYP